MEKEKKSSLFSSLRELTNDLTQVSLGFIYDKVTNPFRRNMFDLAKSSNEEKENMRKLFAVDKFSFGPCPFKVNISDHFVYNKTKDKKSFTLELISEHNRNRKQRLERRHSINCESMQSHLELEDLNPYYISEKYEVVTQDGFIITVFRVYVDSTHHQKYRTDDYFNNEEQDDFAGKNDLKDLSLKRDHKAEGLKHLDEGSLPVNRKQAVLIQHGIVDSSDGFLVNSEDKCLPLVLARQGYDVWISNTRGNYYAEEHLYLDYIKDSKSYYDFSLDEMGRFDLPAVINHIQQTRNSSSKLILFAHSQGSASAFSGMSFNNDFYSSRIKLFIALAPVCKMTGLTSPLLKFSTMTEIEKVMSVIGMYSIGHRSQTLSYLSSKHLNNFNFKIELANQVNKIKTEEPKSRWDYFKSYFNIRHNLNMKFGIDCTSFMFGLLTDGSSQSINDPSALTKLIVHNPSGASVKSFLHFKNNMYTDSFKRYDYGTDENKKKYGTSFAPDYDVHLITIPTLMMYGSLDKLVNEDDIDTIHSKMFHSILSVKRYNNMGHISFQVGKDATWINDALRYCEEYSHK